MKKINILFLVLSLDVGGTERHIYNLLLNLNREKFNPVVSCLYDLGSIGTMLINNKEGINVYHNLMRNRWDISGVLKLINIFKKENIHILYTINSPLTQFWGTISAKLATVDACVTRVAITKPIFHGKRRIIINKIMLPFVDKIIAQAYSHKEYLISEESLNPEKIEVIYNGVELERFQNPANRQIIRQMIGIPVDVPVVGIVARLSPEKGHLMFLKAARKIINIFPHAHFLIVGDGKERKKLEEMSRDLPIQSNVHFLGFIKDIPAVVSLFDVGVLASNKETFSNAVLEYMAASKAVVATNAGSTSELVIHGETGYLIPCGDSEALGEKVIELLKDKQLAEKMGEAGKKRVTERFSIERMAKEYESFFDVLASQKAH